MTPPDDVSTRLSEIRERVEAATEGPWKLWNGWGPSERDGKHRVSKVGPSAYHKNAIHADGADIVGRAEDLEFLTAARSDVPYLLLLVEAIPGDEVLAAAQTAVDAQLGEWRERAERNVEKHGEEGFAGKKVRELRKAKEALDTLETALRDAAQEGDSDG